MLSRIEIYGPLNTHDLIKVVALLLMTIDHIGAYLMPDELWWRVVGRLSFPLWFFLIGYSGTTRMRPAYWWGALIVLLAQMATYHPLLPLNILVTVIMCIYALRLDARFRLVERFPLECLVALFLIHVVAGLFIEYGAVAVMFVAFGRMVRLGLRGVKYTLFWLGMVATHLIWQSVVFAFDVWQESVATMAVVFLCAALCAYTHRPLAWQLPAAWDWTAKLLSRTSLEYYVIHRPLLQFIGAYVLHTHALVPRFFD